MSNEELNKSIDAMIDELFSEEEIEKALGEPAMGEGESKTKADEVVNKAPKGKKDAGNGRPVDIHDIPETDKDDKSKGYDAVQFNSSDKGAIFPKLSKLIRMLKKLRNQFL